MSPDAACWTLEPALPALILLPTCKAYAHLSGRPEQPPLQNEHQPIPQSTMCVIAVDLVRRALLEPSNDIVKVTIVRLAFFRRKVKGAFNP